ncbi:MAG: hypothetical protein M3O62_04435 [Pseudomonadota bacterium]|nr:hypothetical protein [Pseudomonadota bacterium]
MSSYAGAPKRALSIVVAVLLSLSACGSSVPLASLVPTPTPGVDEPAAPVIRCAPPLADGSAQLVRADCIAPAMEHAS